jgi:membrane protein implicated in regulation of membrane protease activity
MKWTSTFFWVAAGLILISAEMFHLSMVLLFFGVAALIVATAKFLGLDNLPFEITLFAALGIGGLLLFRRKLLRSLKVSTGLSIDKNAVILLTHDLPAHGSAAVVYQGSAWTAVNETDADLKKGTKVYIHRTEGVKLIVYPGPVSASPSAV